jgi:hypothetical protein
LLDRSVEDEDNDGATRLDVVDVGGVRRVEDDGGIACLDAGRRNMTFSWRDMLDISQVNADGLAILLQVKNIYHNFT